MQTDTKTYLLVLVGFALLLNPLVPGVHLGDGQVYRYEAASVEYQQNGSLQVTSVRTGEPVDQVSVDDELVCFGNVLRRTCQFEYHVLDGGNVSSYPRSFGWADYEFVFAQGRLYRPTAVERGDDWYADLEPVNESDPLRYVAARSDVPRIERRLVAEGRLKTYRKLPHHDQLIEVDGEYYTLYATAAKSYSGGGGSFCSSGGEGFCEAADRKRLTDTALTLGSWLAGLWVLARARRQVRRE